MRFVLFDRVLELKKDREAILLKNVCQSEDYFIDHFPGYPLVPAGIILGSFEQGAEILLGASCDFLFRPVLRCLSRASFKHFVVPGDQLKIHLAIESTAPIWIKALAKVEGKQVADAMLEFTMENPDGNPRDLEVCKRLKLFYKLLTSSSVSNGWDVLGRQS